MTINASYIFEDVETVPVYCFVFKEYESPYYVPKSAVVGLNNHNKTASVSKYYIISRHFKVNYYETQLLWKITGISYKKALQYATMYKLKLIQDY